MSRATTSVGPAAAKGTTILTGRSGYPGTCANAALAKRTLSASPRAITFAILMAFLGVTRGKRRLIKHTDE
jgi:hypothetical protein